MFNWFKKKETVGLGKPLKFTFELEKPPIIQNVYVGKEGQEYPCLMVAKVDNVGMVVLFTGPSEGTIIKDVHKAKYVQYPLGYYSTRINMDTFEPFNGSVLLRNY